MPCTEKVNFLEFCNQISDVATPTVHWAIPNNMHWRCELLEFQQKNGVRRLGNPLENGNLHSLKLTACPRKSMVGRWISFWDEEFSAAMLVSGSVTKIIHIHLQGLELRPLDVVMLRFVMDEYPQIDRDFAKTWTPYLAGSQKKKTWWYAQATFVSEFFPKDGHFNSFFKRTVTIPLLWCQLFVSTIPSTVRSTSMYKYVWEKTCRENSQIAGNWNISRKWFNTWRANPQVH